MKENPDRKKKKFYIEFYKWAEEYIITQLILYKWTESVTIQTKSVNPNKDVSFSDLSSENKGFQFESAAGYVQRGALCSNRPVKG